MFAVIILLVEHLTRRRFMLLAQEAGMTNGEYIFISVNELVDLTAHDPYALWSTGDANDNRAKEAFRSFYEVRSRQLFIPT